MRRGRACQVRGRSSSTSGMREPGDSRRRGGGRSRTSSTTPPPMASPLATPMVTWGRRSSSSHVRPPRCARARRSRSLTGGSGRRSPSSAPAENARPAPVRTTTRTVWSVSREPQEVLELVVQGDAQGVQLLGAVERDRQQTVERSVAVDLEVVVARHVRQSPPPPSCAFPVGIVVDNRPRSGDNQKGSWISLGISRKSLTGPGGRSNIASPQRNGAVRELRSDRRLRPTENPRDRNRDHRSGRTRHPPSARLGRRKPTRSSGSPGGGGNPTGPAGTGRIASATRSRNGHRPPELRLRRAMWVIDARLTPGNGRLVDPRPTGGPGAAEPLRRGGARGRPRFGVRLTQGDGLGAGSVGADERSGDHGPDGHERRAGGHDLADPSRSTGVELTAPEDHVIVVTFGHDGRVSGSTGVNQLTASYNVTPEYLTFGPMATTRRAGLGGADGAGAPGGRVVGGDVPLPALGGHAHLRRPLRSRGAGSAWRAACPAAMATSTGSMPDPTDEPGPLTADEDREPGTPGSAPSSSCSPCVALR